MFWICRHCDRGQRYCSDACRLQARRGSAAAPTAATSEARKDGSIIVTGNAEYRRRRAARVTDQGSAFDLFSGIMRLWDSREPLPE